MKPHPEVEILIFVRQQHGAMGQAVRRVPIDVLLGAFEGPTGLNTDTTKALVDAFLEASANVRELHREPAYRVGRRISG